MLPEQVRHNCGVAVTHTLHDAYAFIKSLQHRGRDAVGIAAVGNGTIDVVKWIGKVETVDLVDLHKLLPSPNYHTYLAHVRYATKGSKRELLADAHPHVIGGDAHDYGSHHIIRGCEAAAIHNGHIEDLFLQHPDADSGAESGAAPLLPTSSCDTERLLHLYRQVGEREVLRRVPGAYLVAIADARNDHVIVLRDRTGIRPAVLGLKDGKHVVASEDIALRKNGADFIEDLDLGSVYRLAADGDYEKELVVEPAPAHCFFEWNYIADRDSIVEGLYVKKLRRALGEMLAEELDLDSIDYISYFPRAPEDAARGMVRASGKQFRPLFYKLRGERAFQGPTPGERAESISTNIYLIPDLVPAIDGRRLLVVDDSIVRGNNMRHERVLLSKVGIGGATKALYTPPIGVAGEDGVERGCLFGIDMPPDDDFYARGRTLEEMRDDEEGSIVYLTVDGMLEAFERLGMPRSRLCTYCIGGPHPYAAIPDLELPQRSAPAGAGA